MPFLHRIDEINFWSCFGYIDAEVIYCAECNEYNCQRNDSHE